MSELYLFSARTRGQAVDGPSSIPTPTPGTPKESPTNTPQMAPQGPSQLLTALLARLPDATNRTLIDQAAVDFAFLNSKAARKRLVKFMTQIPKNRSDLLPHYSRLIAILNRYMPDVGSEIVAAVRPISMAHVLELRRTEMYFDSSTKSSVTCNARRTL